MSPFSKLVILDNNCISNFYLAGSLESVLILWPFKVFVVPQRVVKEAGNWREHGEAVCRILHSLSAKGIIEIVAINEESEEETGAYALLRLNAWSLGQGESESIAMASHRGYIVATDDRLATECCRKIFPSVEVVTTGDILKMGKSDGLLKESQIEKMWKLIKQKRAKRG
mgnify:CR=1 FL=1